MINYSCDRCNKAVPSTDPKGKTNPLVNVEGKDVCQSCKNVLDVAVTQVKSEWAAGHTPQILTTGGGK